MIINESKRVLVLVGKMALVFLALFMLAGLTGCEQAEKAMEDVVESATEVVDGAKEKASAVLDSSNADDASDEDEDEDDD